MRSEEFIKCFVRLKPILLGEAAALTAARRDVTISKSRENYSYSEVFADSANNEQIYRTAVMPVMDDLLAGFSACVLAYGQTSSGKTYTMKGTAPHPGLIPLSIKEIFGRVEEQGLLAKVSISYFEIYNENIIDLLANDEPARYLQVREDGKKNIVIVDLIEQEVQDESAAIAFYQQGEMRRKFASNNINFQSSRSHTIFKVTLSKMEERRRVEGSIYMVDLAGSESISKTNAVGVLKKEAENINKSLLALTTAIRAISERQAYVNYRNSKLTRILQPSLCGNSKTIVICTVKQTDDSLPETLNTLKFGLSASNIRTDPKQRIFDEGDNKELKDMLDLERAERAKLDAQLQARNVAAEEWRMEAERVQGELEECKHRLFALENENRHHSGLIDYFRSEQEREKNTKNISHQKAEETIAMLEQDAKRLRASHHALKEALEKRDKQVATLEKSERNLLDKVNRYEREVKELERQSLEARNDQRAKVITLSSGAPPDVPLPLEHSRKTEQLNFYDLARRRPEQQPERISSPFTIGKVIDLSNTILGIKIDMNHYLKTITELHEENSDKQAQIDSLQAQLDKAQRKAEEAPREGPPRRESVGSKPKDEERRLRHEVEQLKLKCAHYLKILKKSANNNITSIEGFNDYLDKNFKDDKRALFHALFQEDPADYDPTATTLPRPRKTHPHAHAATDTQPSSRPS